MALLLSGKVSSFSVLLLALGFSFMSAHWFLLSIFVDCLGRGEKQTTVLWGLIVPFPLLLALAVVYVACRVDVRMVLPVVAGLLSIPVAGVCYGLFNGLLGCLRTAVEKGIAS